MAKKGPLNDLYELIPEYGEIKAHYDILKKQESEKNRLIK